MFHMKEVILMSARRHLESDKLHLGTFDRSSQPSSPLWNGGPIFNASPFAIVDPSPTLESELSVP